MPLPSTETFKSSPLPTKLIPKPQSINQSINLGPISVCNFFFKLPCPIFLYSSPSVTTTSNLPFLGKPWNIEFLDYVFCLSVRQLSVFKLYSSTSKCIIIILPSIVVDYRKEIYTFWWPLIYKKTGDITA